jgi:glycosyltransferase involved in cell wall biosynthesis
MNIDPNDIVLASFGHIHESKRTIPVLMAFARICKIRDDLKYIFVGKMAKELNSEFYRIVEEHAIGDKVHVTGYTDLEKFVDYIDVADICVNLRYPYNGETSGSLMRLLAKGKCIMVNDMGSFGEIPNDCCIKLPSVETMSTSEEIDIIYEKFFSLINEGETRKNIEIQARKFAEEKLDINVVAKFYEEFINDMNKSHLDEKLLTDIKNIELKDKNYSDNDIYLLSKTLGYSNY